MRPLDFQIILDDPINPFSAGSMVSGKVLVRLTETLRMTRLRVEVLGGGEVGWTEQTSRLRDQDWEEVPDHFTAKETYLSQETTLCNLPELAPGQHLFPFSFPLPLSLPSSFESQYGHVRYIFRAEIVQAWYKNNHKTEQPIRVQGMLELPSSSQLPGRASNHKNLGALCWKAGPIAATLTTERTGFLPGARMVATAEVGNQSTRTVTGCGLRLVQEVTYCTQRKNRTETKVVAEVERGGLAPGSLEVWDGVVLEVPLEIAPTDLARGYGILRVQYRLELRVKPSGLSTDLVVSLPIIICTAQPSGLALPPSQTLPSVSARESFGKMKPSAPSLPSDGPPSYAEAVWGQKNDREDSFDFELV